MPLHYFIVLLVYCTAQSIVDFPGVRTQGVFTGSPRRDLLAYKRSPVPPAMANVGQAGWEEDLESLTLRE